MAKKVEEKKKTKKADNKEHKIVEKIKRAVKPPKKQVESKRFEDRGDLEKILLVTIVVEQNVADNVLKMLQNLGSSAQFVHNGRGTAPSEISGVLNANINNKAVINAFVGEDKLHDIEEELDAFFKVGKKNRGIAFAVPLSSIQGIRMYKYLTQTI